MAHNLTSRPPVNRDTIAPLTGLRGYAALWVALSHFSFTDTLWQAFGNRIQWGIAEGVLRHEYLAVDLFFMLSGFVLMHVHGHEFSERLTVDSHKRFLLLRLARIYPLHLLGLLLMLPLQWVDIGIDGLRTPISFITQLLLVASWGMNWQLSWNLPSWSLSSEWMAYLLFPLIAWTVNRIHHRAGQILVLAFVFTLFYWLMFRLPVHMNYSNGAGAAVRVLCGMISGTLLYKLHNSDYIKPAVWTLLFWLAIPIALSTMTDLQGIRLHENIWAVVMMAVLLITASRATGLIMLPLTHRVAIYMGEISFSIYILHYPVFRFLRWIFRDSYSNLADNGSIFQVHTLSLATFIILICVCALAHHAIENPFRNWAKQHIT